jgi:hypothetical protein
VTVATNLLRLRDRFDGTEDDSELVPTGPSFGAPNVLQDVAGGTPRPPSAGPGEPRLLMSVSTNSLLPPAGLFVGDLTSSRSGEEVSAAAPLTLRGMTCGASGSRQIDLVPTVVRTLERTAERTVGRTTVPTVVPPPGPSCGPSWRPSGVRHESAGDPPHDGAMTVDRRNETDSMTGPMTDIRTLTPLL